MKKADIKTGFLCNNNCLFCVQGPEKKVFGNKKTSELKATIKEAVKDCDIIVFTGGEPTVRKDILELVGYAKKNGFKTIQIQSNGRMFAYEKFCRDMVTAGANEFGLALHGHTAKLHDYLTGAESFAQTVTGIRNLKRIKQTVIMNTVITRSNYRHLPEIAKLLVSLNVDKFQFAFVHALGAAGINFDKIVPRMSMVAPFAKEALRIGRYFNVIAETEAMPYCILSGYEECVAEAYMPVMKIFDQEQIVLDYTKARIVEGKEKGPQCKECSYDHICEGLWKEYPKIFGWEEFMPIKKKE